MAAGNFTLTHQGKLDLFNEDFELDAHYAILVLAAHTPNVATDITLSNVSASECADTDYIRRDVVGETVTQAAGTVTIDCNDISFGDPVTITAKYLYILRGTVATAAATDRIVGFCDLNTSGNLVSTNGAYVAQVPSLLTAS